MCILQAVTVDILYTHTSHNDLNCTVGNNQYIPHAQTQVFILKSEK